MVDFTCTNVKTSEPLVLFLYSLVKDYMTLGQIQDILEKDAILEMVGERTLTNGPAALFAQDLARSLTGVGGIGPVNRSTEEVGR